MTKKRIHLLYSILLSVMLAVTGICLCVACVGIYLSGNQPFSREAVAAAFRYISVPVYLCIALAVGGLILDAISPAEYKKRKHTKKDDSHLSEPPKSGHKLLYLRLALLGIGIAIFAYGFLAGGTADVMTKAVNICTECVGLG